MKKIKCSISLLLSVLMIVSTAFCTGVTAFAEDGDILDYLQYTIADNKVTITKSNSGINGDVVIPDTIEGYPVTAIGQYAFSSCENITNVKLPETVTEIGEAAFYWCSKLESINIPGSVTNIAENAFYYCRALTSIIIPDSVKEIGESAFNYCTALESVTIGNGVEKIGRNAFYWCSKLTEVVIPDSVITIEEMAFSYCSALENVTIGKNVTTIGQNAFGGCSSLKNITIPGNVTTIDGKAFWTCSSLESVTLETGIKTIGDQAFWACSSLKSITIPASMTSISQSAFSASIEYIDVDKNNENYSNDEYGVFFNNDKTELILYPDGNKRTEYAIPDTVTTIDASAFKNCDNLEYITIPASVATIGDGAFNDCDNLVSCIADKNDSNFLNDKYGVLYDKDQTRLVHYPMCSSMTEYVIPNSVTSIDKNAFNSCTNLTSVIIGSGVKTIGDNAFEGCRNLKNIIIPSNVTSIGEYAFNTTSSILESITILNPDCEINDYRFTIRASAIIYGYPGSTAESYANKYGRTFMEIGTENESEVYESLTYKVVDGTVKIIACDKAAEGTIIIPDMIGEYPVTGIGADAFADCTSITEIILPDSVKVIEANTFSGCTALKKVVATGVETIGENAFTGCSALDTVVTFADSLSVADNAFDANEKLTVFVKDTAAVTAPDALKVITFSFADGILSFNGEYKSDLYYLFDLVSVMCSYYDNVQYLFFNSFEAVSADGKHIYYYTDASQRVKFDGTKMTNVKFSIEMFDGEGFKKYSFNELCEKVVANEVDNFNLVIEEADGLDKGCIEVSLVEKFNAAIQRILKAITNLINKLFSFFKAFTKK